MRLQAFYVSFLLVASMKFTTAGTVTPVSIPPNETRFARPFLLLTSQFNKAPHGCGAIAKNARVAGLGNGSAVRVALDADEVTAKQFTCLRFDFNGSGKFTKQFTAELPTTHDSNGNLFGTIAPRTFTVPIHGRKTPVTISGNFQRLPNSCFIYLYITTALKGACQFANNSHPVYLVNSNGSLHCGEKWPLIASEKGFSRIGAIGDMLIVDLGAGKKPLYGYYGHPMQVDGAWYMLKLSTDGSTLSASPFTGPKGTLQFDYSCWDATLVGKYYYINLSSDTKTTTVPIDSYTLLDFHGYPAAGDGKTCRIQMMDVAGTGKEIIVPAAGMKHVGVGTGIIAHINVTQNHRNITFALVITDTLENALSSVTLANGTPGAVKIPFEVVDARGQTLCHGDFEHGYGGYCTCSWPVPKSIHGALTARITPLKVPPFQVTVTETKFSVKD